MWYSYHYKWGLIKICLYQIYSALNNSNKKRNSKSKVSGNEELLNLDKELKDLIKKNESLKVGITKIFKEIEKKNSTNNSN